MQHTAQRMQEISQKRASKQSLGLAVCAHAAGLCAGVCACVRARFGVRQ